MARFSTPSGFYELNPFPGCNQIVVSNHAFVREGARGKGVGSSAHQARLQHIKELGYDYAICTVVSTNEPQINILVKNGWVCIGAFHNRETGNMVQIWGRLMTTEIRGYEPAHDHDTGGWMQQVCGARILETGGVCQ